MTNKRYVSEIFFCRCLLWSLLARLASLDAKNINLEVVPFRKLAFLRLFFPFVLRLRLILQQVLCLLSICFALFVVNNVQREFRNENLSSYLSHFL